MDDLKQTRFIDNIKVFLIVVICILINYTGKAMASILELPLWLDSVGTAMCAYIYGPVCGAIVGVTNNLIYGIGYSMTLVYSMVSLATGVIIGVAAKKEKLNSFFETSKMSTLVAFVATVLSTPLNLFFYDGKMGNKWGDAVLEFLAHHGVRLQLASFIGEFFIDFADKIISLSILYLLIKIVRSIRKRKSSKKESIKAVTAICLLSVMSISCFSTVTVTADTVTDEADYNSYIQTIYNNSNGLSCGEANDIVATNDGVLWIATYAGLYRYSGSEFQYMDGFSSIKNANDLFVDDEGRLWVGTNDMGLSICSREQISNVLDVKNGLPSNSVRSIVRNSYGDYLVGTSGSLAVVSLAGGIQTKKVIDEISHAKCLTSDTNGHTVAVTAAGTMYLLSGTEIVGFISKADEYFTSCRYNSDGMLYATTDTDYIYVYDTILDKFEKKHKIAVSELNHLNNTYEMENGTIFVCADNGIGYLDEHKKLHIISTGSFNSSIDNMMVDYQGNIWLSSSRQGLLKLCPSAFSELYSISNIDEKVVNSVAVWRGDIYSGTDNGLDIINKATNEVIKNDLTEMLSGVRIRNIFIDSKDRLWISTNVGKVIRVEKDGTVMSMGKEDGLIGTKLRQALELRDGTVAIASDLGVSLIDDEGIVYTVDGKEGLTNTIILCMCERDDNALLLGTDGGGMAVIDKGQIIKTISADDLGSGVVLRIVDDRDNDGFFIVTSNGLCYLSSDYEVSRLSSFPYSNNYDIYDNGNGLLFVTGSAGIYVVKKDELLYGKVLYHEQLNYKNGLRQSLTANAWNYVDNDDIWYICSNVGVTKLDLKQYQQGVRSFRLITNTMKIDNVTHMVDRSEDIVLSAEDAVLELNPEIINYTSEDPIVRYYMEGYDKKPVDVRQSLLREVEYKGLPSGTYKFHLAVLDKYNNVAEEQVYTIVRQQEFYERKIVIVYFVFELAVIAAWLAWVITRMSMEKALENKNREIEHALEQVRLGNETILTIAKTVDAKDGNTSQHSFRVSEYSVLIGKKLGYDEEQCENLRKSALLHDIGKIGIPDSILNKTSRLTDKEYEIMKSHVTSGGEILKNITVIPHVKEGALYHHERYDGKGYAHGLKGEEIPEFARIIGVADTFDAMTANRVYRKQLELSYVIEELKKGRGTQFDPKMADIMLELIADGEIDIEKLYRGHKKEDLNE